MRVGINLSMSMGKLQAELELAQLINCQESAVVMASSVQVRTHWLTWVPLSVAAAFSDCR